MQIQISRISVFIIGIIAIIFFVFLNRIEFILGSEITHGKKIGDRITSRRNYVYPVIQFETKKSIITFGGEINMEIDNPMDVPVIYKINEPTNAMVYTIVGFWMSPFIYAILPLLFLTAAVFSLLSEKEGLRLTLPFGNKKTEETKEIERTKLP